MDCDVTRVQSATQWTTSVHTLHMSKPNATRVQSATEWTASVHTLHMLKSNVTRVLIFFSLDGCMALCLHSPGGRPSVSTN